MKSLLASVAFAGITAAALAVAQSQTMPDATPSMCPSPSIANGLVDSTMRQDCVTPRPSPTQTPHRMATQPPGLPTPTPYAPPTAYARPTPQPTSKGEMR